MDPYVDVQRLQEWAMQPSPSMRPTMSMLSSPSMQPSLSRARTAGSPRFMFLEPEEMNGPGVDFGMDEEERSPVLDQVVIPTGCVVRNGFIEVIEDADCLTLETKSEKSWTGSSGRRGKSCPPKVMKDRSPQLRADTRRKTCHLPPQPVGLDDSQYDSDDECPDDELLPPAAANYYAVEGSPMRGATSTPVGRFSYLDSPQTGQRLREPPAVRANRFGFLDSPHVGQRQRQPETPPQRQLHPGCVSPVSSAPMTPVARPSRGAPPMLGNEDSPWPRSPTNPPMSPITWMSQPGTPIATSGGGVRSPVAGAVQRETRRSKGRKVPDQALLVLRGLPFNVTEEDVLLFVATAGCSRCLANIEQPVKLLTNTHGRPSGFAEIQLNAKADFWKVQEKLHHLVMGGRYIEALPPRTKNWASPPNGYVRFGKKTGTETWRKGPGSPS